MAPVGGETQVLGFARNKKTVLDQKTFFVAAEADLFGRSLRVFQEGDNVLVITETYDGLFGKVFKKTELGLR